jgi:cell wall-associated NlpC family hydrolase
VPAKPPYRSFLRALVAAASLAGGFGVSSASAATATPTRTQAVSGSVTAGQGVQLTASVHARAHGVKGLRLELFRLAPSGRVLVTTVTTDTAGSVAATVAPAVTTRYYWRFAGTSAYEASGSRITITVAKAVVVPLGRRAVSEAARHVGAPYVYGATGPSAFDCSGFTQYVFGRLGVGLPRTAAAQYGAVRHVADADKQVGDLIFFRLGGGGIDHVGIYAGGNQIVVAPKTGDHVRYEAIWTSYSVGRAG